MIMRKALRRLVWDRAHARCEYCRLPQSATLLPHAIDHVVAQQHKGATDAENLALSCLRCNSFKGPNIAGRDPETGRIIRLFNPRMDAWDQHFAWQGAILVGRTDVGRTTIDVLNINQSERVALRVELMAVGPEEWR
jgi:hypothetical protein